MRIGILSDASFAERPGGASRATDLYLASAPPDLDLIPCPPDQVDRECDGYLAFLTKLYSDEEYAFLCDRPFLRVEYDYWQQGEAGWQWRDRLNDKARKILFVSPLHRQVYAYRNRYETDSLWDEVTGVLPPPMDPSIYAPIRARWDAEGRLSRAIWYGEWHWFKGPDIAMGWALHHHTPLDMFSPSMPPGSRPPNQWVQFCGFAPEEGWLDIVAQHQRFVHFPRVPECFPYSMLEAYLLGCEVTVSGRLGVESYGLPLDEVVALASESRTRLWEIVRETLA